MLKIESPDNEDVQIAVTDIVEEKFMRKKEVFLKTILLEEIFSSGVYKVKVTQGQNVQTLRLVKASKK